MTNQFVLIGRIVKIDGDDELIKVTISVPRQFKNQNGEYESDLIPCLLNGYIAKNITEYCNKGDVIGIRGRIQINDNNIQIIGEKITFLSSKKGDE